MKALWPGRMDRGTIYDTSSHSVHSFKMSGAHSTSLPVPCEIISKFVYPTGTPCEKPVELGIFSVKTPEANGSVLPSFLAIISDCLSYFEVEGDFNDDNMKLAYLAMKNASAHDDAKTFLILAMLNRDVLNWANVMLIWAFVKSDHDPYWARILEDLPPMSSSALIRIVRMLTAARKFRGEWKTLHEANRISHAAFSYGMEGFSVQLFGK